MDYYKDGKFRRTIRGTKAKVDGKIVMGLDSAVGAPKLGIYPRVNEPTPAYNPITEKLVTSFALARGKSVRSFTVAARADATERQAAEDERVAKEENDQDVRDGVAADAFTTLLDTAKINQIRKRIDNIAGNPPTVEGLKSLCVKLAIALADYRRS